MSGIFQYKDDCNPDISQWDVSRVTNFVSGETKTIIIMLLYDILQEYFYSSMIIISLVMCLTFFVIIMVLLPFLSLLLSGNHVLADLCILQDYMFYGASSFNQDIGGWNVSDGYNFVSGETNTIIIMLFYLYDILQEYFYSSMIIISLVMCLTFFVIIMVLLSSLLLLQYYCSSLYIAEYNVLRCLIIQSRHWWMEC